MLTLNLHIFPLIINKINLILYINLQGLRHGPVAPWGGGPQVRWDQRQHDEERQGARGSAAAGGKTGPGALALQGVQREGCYFSR